MIILMRCRLELEVWCVIDRFLLGGAAYRLLAQRLPRGVA